MKPKKIKCIIHIDGDLWYEEKRVCSRKQKKIKESSSIKRSKNILKLRAKQGYRIVPICDRRNCYKTCMKARSDRMISDNWSKNIRNDILESYSRYKIKNEMNPVKSNISNMNTLENTYIEGLSPISLEENLEFSYDNVSSDSLCINDIEALSTKVKEPKSEQDINESDSLLKTSTTKCLKQYSSPNHNTRTIESIVQKTPLSGTSTPFSEDNATVFSSEMDVSVHSLETVVMDPYLDNSIYSPNTSPSELIPDLYDYADVAVDEDGFKEYVKKATEVTLHFKDELPDYNHNDILINKQLETSAYSPSNSPLNCLPEKYQVSSIKKENVDSCNDYTSDTKMVKIEPSSPTSENQRENVVKATLFKSELRNVKNEDAQVTFNFANIKKEKE